jgi:GNAT superfamily N-acetyltransferase
MYKMNAENKPVSLCRATEDDIETVWKMQVEAFSGLLEKYQDYDLSPAAEGMERVAARFGQLGSAFYFICADGKQVGVIRIVDLQDGSQKRISPIWVMPEYRNHGYAQRAILAAEELYGAEHWSLDTILQEKGNVHLYEKLGYHRVGEPVKINERMDLVYYEK